MDSLNLFTPRKTQFEAFVVGSWWAGWTSMDIICSFPVAELAK